MNSEKQYTNLQMTLREVNRVGEGQKNVPKLRFKGYEDAWEQRKLGEVCERVVRKNKNYESDLPLTIASQFGLIDQRDFFGKIVAAKDMSNYYLLKKGEFAYNKSYSKGFDFGSIKRLNNYELGCLSTLYICFQIASNRVESDYLEVYFDTLNWYKDVMSICAEGARNHGLLNVDTKAFFEEVNVDIPREILEQKNIASSLEKVEKLITLHQRKYDALKSMKKTLLSKMFPKNGEDVPEIRFKEFTDAWEQRKLGEIVLSEIKGSAKAEMIGGDTPYLETNYLNGGECLFVDSENNVDTDDVIVLWDGSQAGTVYHGFSGALGSTFKAYKTKCLGLFIFQQLKKNQQTIYDKYRTPNIPHVIKTFKDEYDVMLTSEEEQNEIGRYFQQIDHLITLHQRKLEELKNMKKTLLQQMFV